MRRYRARLIKRKLKSNKQNIRRKKASEESLYSSSTSALDVEEVFPETDTKGIGCVYSDVDVKEEDLVDNSIMDNKEDCVLSYLDEDDESSVAHIQGKVLSCIQMLFQDIYCSVSW